MNKKRERAKPSIDLRPALRVPRAWPFDDLVPQIVAAFARQERIAGSTEARIRAAVAAQLDGRDRIRDVLRGLSALEIVVLEILAEVGGRLTVQILTELARERTGCNGSAVDAALDGLDLRLLTARLTAQMQRGAGVSVASLASPAAEHVAALVCGVSLPSPAPPAAAKPSATASRRRDVLAVAGLTAHRALRFNLDGTPNAGQLARFGKDLAPPPTPVTALLREAARLDLLGAVGDTFAPIANALLKATADIDADLDAWLPATDWVTAEALERAALRARIELFPRSSLDLAPLTEFRYEQEAIVSPLKGAPGAEHVEAGGHTWIRRRGAADRRGDGHVTPSFEVMLGPAADLEIVATIALGCELVRLDRVLTFRITPASVAAGLSSGLEAATLLSALDRVGRHPLPGNVRTMVGDWIARHRPASLVRAWLVRVPPEAADSLAATDLAKSILDRPAPGVLAIDPAVTRGQLVKHLAKHGVSLGPPLALEDAIANRDEERWGPEGSYRALRDSPREAIARPAQPLLLPLTFEGDPALREKVTAARASGFATPRPTTPNAAPNTPPASRSPLPAPSPAALLPSPSQLASHAPPTPEASALSTATVEAMLAEARALELAADLVDALASLGAMYVEEVPELERWAARLPPETRSQVDEALTSPITLAPFWVLAPKARQSVLAKSPNVGRLLEESLRSGGFGRLSPRGAAVMTGLRDAALALDARRGKPGAKSRQATSDKAAATASLPSPTTSVPAAPRPAGFPVQSRTEVHAALLAACAKSALVRLHVRAGAAVEIHTVLASSIQPRGSGSAFLAIDPETDEGRVYAVADVLAVTRTGVVAG